MQHESQCCPLIGPSSSVHSEFHFLQCFPGEGGGERCEGERSACDESAAPKEPRERKFEGSAETGSDSQNCPTRFQNDACGGGGSSSSSIVSIPSVIAATAKNLRHPPTGSSRSLLPS